MLAILLAVLRAAFRLILSLDGERESQLLELLCSDSDSLSSGVCWVMVMMEGFDMLTSFCITWAESKIMRRLEGQAILAVVSLQKLDR